MQQQQQKPTVILASAGYDHSIRLWDVASGSSIKTLKVPESQVNALAISPDKRFIAAACNPMIKIFDLTRNPESGPFHTLEGHVGNVTAIGYDAAGRWIFSGGADGTVRVWDPRSGQCECVFSPEVPKSDDWHDAQRFAINAVALHPNQGELLVGDQGGRVRVCDLISSVSTVLTTPEPDVAIRSLSVAGDGSRVFIATDSGTVHQWAPPSCDSMLNVSSVVLKPFQAHQTYCLKCCVSPDLKYLATTSADHTCKIWKISNLSQPVKVLSKHQLWVWDVSFSADSSYLVTACSDHSVRLFDVSSGELIRLFNGHAKAVVAVALSD